MLRRNAFWVVAPVLVIIAVVVSVLVFERVTGDLEWKAYVREARLRKVKLTVSEILPAWPPDEENFAATPLFERPADTGTGVPALRRFELPAVRIPPGTALPTLESELEKCSLIDLLAWRKRFVTSGWISDDHTLSDARSILLALERFAPDLDLFREAAQRPQCRFPVNWNDPLRAPMPHSEALHRVRAVLRLRSEALLNDGRTSDALEELELLLTLTRRMKGEPGTWSNLFLCEAPMKDTCNLVWSGICSGTWDMDSLKKIEAELKTLNVLGSVRWALESERALVNAVYDRFNAKDLFAAIDPLKNGAKAPLESTTQVLSGAYMSASFQRNRVRTNRYINDLLTQFDEYNRRYTPKDSPWEPTDQSTTKYSKLKQVQFSISDLLDGGYESEIRRGLKLHTRVQQARIACALERYRLSRGVYPENLRALVPDYLSEIPHDVCDGASMRYRLDSSRRYILHAIGMDQKDDGGKPYEHKAQSTNIDWVWTYPAR